MTKAIIIGGGSWGTAIAAALITAGTDAKVLARSDDTVGMLAEGRCRQIADIAAASPIPASTDPAILRDANLIFIVVPVKATIEALTLVRREARQDAIIILCAKGLVATDKSGGLLMHEVASEQLSQHPVVVFSGPSFADEVLRGLPAAITAASNDKLASSAVQSAFRGSNIRVYSSNDPVGVAIGGAMKNVIAIAAGCAVGLQLGDNARAAIITRGLAEMARFASAAGAAPDTIFGLSGAGDLALSCAGPHSRNMAYGLALGKGHAPDPVLAEGRHTVAALAARGERIGVDQPITKAVDNVVNHGHNLPEVVAGLLARQVGNE